MPCSSRNFSRSANSSSARHSAVPHAHEHAAAFQRLGHAHDDWIVRCDDERGLVLEADRVLLHSTGDHRVAGADLLQQGSLFQGDGVGILVVGPQRADQLQSLLIGGEAAVAVAPSQQGLRRDRRRQFGKAAMQCVQ